MTNFDARANLDMMTSALSAIMRKSNEPPPAAVFDLATGLLSLASAVNVNLDRIATAAERAAELANIDVAATIENGIKAGVEDAVSQRMQENTKRDYIGRK